jgi:hypothetical protein
MADYYTVHTQPFEVGQTVFPDLDALDHASRWLRKTEDLLEECRPEGTRSRLQSVILLADEGEARRICAKTPDGNLYRVTVSKRDIAHKGDRRIVDSVAQSEFRHSPLWINSLPHDYWHGQLTDEPVIEYLAPSATVSEVVLWSPKQKATILTDLVARGKKRA